jgi:hypothetical protein
MSMSQGVAPPRQENPCSKDTSAGGGSVKDGLRVLPVGVRVENPFRESEGAAGAENLS